MPTTDTPGRPGEIESPRQTAAAVAAVVLLLVAHAVLVWLARPAGIDTGGDDARYLLLGQALRHLKYVEYWQAGWPVHSLYPPGYPLLLALWSAAAGGGFDAAIVLSVLCSAGSLLVAYLLVRRYLEAPVALLALAALAFNPTLIERAGTIASELPYELWSALALLFLLAAVRDRERSGHVVAAVAFAILAALTRTAGATLVAAVVVTLLLERRIKAAAWAAAAAAAVLLPWLAWTVMAPRQFIGASYVADALTRVPARSAPGFAGTLVARLLHNGPPYAISFLNSLLPYPDVIPGRADSLAWLAVAVAGLLAGAVAAWRRWRPVLVYLVLYAGLLMAWAWAVSRFLEAVALLLVPLWLYGLWTLARLARIRRPVVVAAAAGAVVILTGAWSSAGLATARARCGREPAPPGPNRCLYSAQLDWMAAVRWVRDSTPADAIVLTVKPGAFYLYSHRETVLMEDAVGRRPAEFVPWLERHRGRYIVLTTVTLTERSRLAQLLAATCRSLAVAANVAPEAYVLRLRAAGEPDSTSACAAVGAYQRAVADSAAGKRWL